jgi:hypothetical protein
MWSAYTYIQEGYYNNKIFVFAETFDFTKKRYKKIERGR